MIDGPIFFTIDPQAPERMRLWSSGLTTFWSDDMALGVVEVWSRSVVRAGRGTSYEQMIAAIHAQYPDRHP